jgi:hypothetical protein
VLDDIETEDEDLLQCQKCKKKFSHSTNLKQHICKGIEGQRDLVHFAMSFAYQRIDQHEFDIEYSWFDSQHEFRIMDSTKDNRHNFQSRMGSASTPWAFL